MSSIKISLAARCEAAGRENNEDNYQIISDITSSTVGFVADEVITLGEKGTVLVACDGMGGMNAGEVASDIATNTIKDWFLDEAVTDKALRNPHTYIEDAIVAADAAIKSKTKADPSTAGMGSTVVLMWLLNGKVYVGWCGDSRAYRYNKKTGLDRLSHDHSYVQELVDAGNITEEMAFYHPQNNIITKSLGDTRGPVKPDVAEFVISEGDIYMLCSDGLCGNLQDAQINSIIENNLSSASVCRDALWKADEEADWHDNVTVIVAKVEDGGAAIPQCIAAATEEPSTNHIGRTVELKQKNKLLIIVIALLSIIVVGLIIFLILYFGSISKPDAVDVEEDDSTKIEVVDDDEQIHPVIEVITIDDSRDKKANDKNNGSNIKKPDNPSQSSLDNNKSLEVVTSPDNTIVPEVKTADDNLNKENQPDVKVGDKSDESVDAVKSTDVKVGNDTVTKPSGSLADKLGAPKPSAGSDQSNGDNKTNEKKTGRRSKRDAANDGFKAFSSNADSVSGEVNDSIKK